MNMIDAIALSIIEGITEFLPISSTGHLILFGKLLNITESDFLKAFNIIIQLGAILSVIVIYYRRLLSGLKIYFQVGIAFLPAAVIGLLVKKQIDQILDRIDVVAIALFLGGIVFILIEKIKKNRNLQIQDLSYMRCFQIGLIQCCAFVPGVSRAGAAMIAGMLVGLDRKNAAEFSFFLAVPTILGASAVKAKDILPFLNPENSTLLLIGIVGSFITGLLAIRFFTGLMARITLTPFGIYRIILGLIVLLTHF